MAKYNFRIEGTFVGTSQPDVFAELVEQLRLDGVENISVVVTPKPDGAALTPRAEQPKSLWDGPPVEGQHG